MPVTGRYNPGVAPASGQQGHAGREYVNCAIIIVTYNSARHIAKLLDSLPAAADGLATRCVVVDNSSCDETLSIVRSRDEAVAVEAGGNLGYAGAINIGRRMAGSCDSVLILNPDLTLEPGAIGQLYKVLSQPGVGVAVPMLRGSDSSVYQSIRREPSLTRAVGDALLGAHWPRRPGWLSEIIREGRAYGQPQDVDWATGAVMLISAACNDAIGEWDSDHFFLYSEETDFAARARRGGYRIRYVPAAQARHEGGGSGHSPELGALMVVNRIRYYEKYHRRPTTSLFRAVVALHCLLRSADPAQRVALRTVVRRSNWSSLPGSYADADG